MKNGNTIRAGLFVLIALAVFVIASLWVAGFQMQGGHVRYDVKMKTAAGIRQGDRIRVAGMEIGRVVSVELRSGEEWPVIFGVALDGEIPVTTAATAALNSDGLLGAPYLEIDPGPAGLELLPEGSTIPGGGRGGAGEAMRGLGELSDRAGVALDEVTALLRSLSARTGPLLEKFELLLSEENLASISASLAAMQETMEASGPKLSSMLTRLDELALQLQTGVEGLPEVTEEIQGLVTDLRTALGPEGQRVSTLLESANRGMESMTMNRAELETMVRDLRMVTANLKAFTETLKERPSSLVRKSRGPDRKPGEGVDP